MLDKIINWAQKEDAVKALILTGSRARNEVVDFLADYDIAVLTTNSDTYTQNNLWLKAIGTPWVVLTDRIRCVDGTEYPTRLIIFDGGVKVDFAFFGIDMLENMGSQSDSYQRFARGYKVLLDKDGLTNNLQVTPLKKAISKKPSQQEFEAVVNEFFFEVYHVAKYLHRNDLWFVKFRDWATKEFLLRMIEWHEKAQHGWDYNTYYLGVYMPLWVGKDTWQALQKTYGHFDAQDSWQALMATVELFRKVATQTAKLLNYQYPVDVDKNIMSFVQTLVTKK